MKAGTRCPGLFLSRTVPDFGVRSWRQAHDVVSEALLEHPRTRGLTIPRFVGAS